MSRANICVQSELNQDAQGQALGTGRQRADEAMKDASSIVEKAYNELVSFFGYGKESESD